MKAFKRREVTDLQHLRTLVADNADAMEPDLKILASNLNFGRTSVELAALDAERVPVLFVLGLTADDAMLIRALEAYAWCLEYPESVQRLAPANTQLGWPPRIVFVAERLLEAFVRKMRLLNFSSVDCFEFRYVEANGTTGFYLDRVDWAPAASAAVKIPPRPQRIEPPVVEEEIPPLERPRVAPREEPRLVLLREEPPEELREELEELPEEPAEEPRVIPRAEPKVIPLVPVEEPRIVMLHEPPRTVERPPRAVEPAPRNREPAPTNGAAGKSTSERVERGPVVLKGLRQPTETPPRRRTRDAPDLLRPPAEQKPPGPREASRPSAPAAPAASGASHVEPKAPPAPNPRPPQQGVESRARADAAKVDLPKNGASRSDPPRGDEPKSDLAPTWRKFLDRLTSTFDTRPTPAAEPPGPSAPPAPTPAAPGQLAIQPFAADIEVDASEVAPDELIDESHESVAELTDKHRLAQAMRQAGQAGVLVSQAGLQIEKR